MLSRNLWHPRYDPFGIGDLTAQTPDVAPLNPGLVCQSRGTSLTFAIKLGRGCRDPEVNRSGAKHEDVALRLDFRFPALAQIPNLIWSLLFAEVAARIQAGALVSSQPFQLSV